MLKFNHIAAKQLYQFAKTNPYGDLAKGVLAHFTLDNIIGFHVHQSADMISVAIEHDDRILQLRLFDMGNGQFAVTTQIVNDVTGQHTAEETRIANSPAKGILRAVQSITEVNQEVTI